MIEGESNGSRVERFVTDRRRLGWVTDSLAGLPVCFQLGGSFDQRRWVLAFQSSPQNGSVILYEREFGETGVESEGSPFSAFSSS